MLGQVSGHVICDLRATISKDSENLDVLYKKHIQCGNGNNNGGVTCDYFKKKRQ